MEKVLKTLLVIAFLLIFSGTVFSTTGKVKTDDLNLRDKASTNSNVIGKLSRGQKVNIINNTENWYEINSDNQSGFVSSQYIEKDKDTSSEEIGNKSTETLSNTNNILGSKKIDTDTKVYSLPLLNSINLDDLKKGNEVKVISKAGNWLYIQTDKLSGWINSNTISNEQSEEKNTTEMVDENTTTSSNIIDSTTDETKTIYYCNVDSVNVRRKASTTSDAITSVSLNDVVEVIDIEGDWYKVKVEGNEGYILSKYLSKK